MGWVSRKLHERGQRALARQLDYQEKKAESFRNSEADLVRLNFIRTQQVRQKLESIRPITGSDKVLEVGSGAHGLIFGMGEGVRVGVDPLAVDYRRLFPRIQTTAATLAAIGEQLPFDDASFDVVMSDNVIDHAERPLAIVDEIIRVLKPSGLLYFTVNVHHPFYDLASRAHGAWNAAGLKIELSAFADHTVHLTEEKIAAVFAAKPLEIIEQNSTAAQVRSTQRSARASNPDAMLKKIFFKNALFELIAKKTNR